MPNKIHIVQKNCKLFLNLNTHKFNFVMYFLKESKNGIFLYKKGSFALFNNGICSTKSCYLECMKGIVR